MNGTDFSALFLEYLGIAIAIIAVLCALAILHIATAYKLFEKLGLRGWLGLVPFLSLYLLFSKLKMKKLYIPTLAVAFAFIVLLGALIAYPDPALLLVIAFCPAAISLFLLNLKMNKRLCASFERGFIFAIFSTVLPTVFRPFVAFSNDQYFERN